MAQSDTIDYAKINAASAILRAANHKLRQNILKLLQENQSMNVTDIYVKLRLEQSVASQHLAILRQAKLVSTQRNGKSIIYSLNIKRIAAVADFVEKIKQRVE